VTRGLWNLYFENLVNKNINQSLATENQFILYNTYLFSMADIAELQLKIKAVTFALDSFADYENDGERRSFLRQNFTAIAGLKTYLGYSESMLQNEKKQLQEMLLGLQRGRNILCLFFLYEIHLFIFVVGVVDLSRNIFLFLLVNRFFGICWWFPSR
jgi:hypothetical protein